MKISNPFKSLDNWLCIQAARVKEKIPEESFERVLFYLDTGIVNKYVANNSVRNSISAKHRFDAGVVLTPKLMLNTISGALAIGTTHFGKLLYYSGVVSSSLVQASNTVNTIDYRRHKSKREAGAINIEEVSELAINKYSRLPLIAMGVGFVLKPIAEYLNSGSCESPYADLIYGIMNLSTASSQYLKVSDDEGLKHKREQKAAKGLETAITSVGI